METGTQAAIIVVVVIGIIVSIYFLIRCWTQGRPCLNRARIDDRTVLITGADTDAGIELVHDFCRRGARVIMVVTNTEIGADVAVDVKSESNGEVIVEYCDMNSLKSIRELTTKILEQESRIHILINLASIQWCPFNRTAEGFETHFGQNHIAHFVVTQLLMPLLHRGSPDARIITVTSGLYKFGSINWEDPNFNERKYSTWSAFNQSKLANVLFSRELARRLEGTGVNTYCVNPGIIKTGLGFHIIQGLGVLGILPALCCWLPWLKSDENAVQTIIYCATEPALTEQSGLYYNDCMVKLTTEKAADMEDSYRLWEMTERLAHLTS